MSDDAKRRRQRPHVMLDGRRAQRHAARQTGSTPRNGGAPAPWLSRPRAAARCSSSRTADETWVLRHYRRGGLVARFIDDHYVWLGAERTRAFREWRLLRKLRAAGLPVPNPVAAHVYRTGVIYTADIITSYLPDTRKLSWFIAQGRAPADCWRRIGAMIRAVHDHGVDHPDLDRAQRAARCRGRAVSRRLRQRGAQAAGRLAARRAANGSTARCARSRSKPARSSTPPPGGRSSRLRGAAPAADQPHAAIAAPRNLAQRPCARSRSRISASSFSSAEGPAARAAAPLPVCASACSASG